MTQIADRLFLSLFTLLIVVSDFATQKKIDFTGEMFFPSLILLIFGILSVLALLDVVINDLLPESCHLRVARRFRQGIWLWIAVTYVGYAFVSVKSQLQPWMVGFYLLCAIRSAAIAFIDLQQKIDSVRRDRRVNDRGSNDRGRLVH